MRYFCDSSFCPAESVNPADVISSLLSKRIKLLTSRRLRYTPRRVHSPELFWNIGLDPGMSALIIDIRKVVFLNTSGTIKMVRRSGGYL